MSFAHPYALLLGLVAIGVVLLYRLRVRVPKATVATGMFWQQALAEEQGRARWQRWREKASLALHLLIVLLAVLAASGPRIPGPRHITLVIDNSVTMSTSDVQPSRLGTAKEVAGRLIAGLRVCDTMAVLASGGTPALAVGPTSDEAVLRTAVEKIGQTSAASSVEAALEAAKAIVPPAGAKERTVVITDACFPNAAKILSQPGVETLRAGTRAGNLAITRWTMRRSTADPHVCEVLAEVRNLADTPSAAHKLTVTLGEKPIETVPVPAIGKDASWQDVIAVPNAEAGNLRVALEPADAYPADNTATVAVDSTKGAEGIASGQPGSPYGGDKGLDLRAPTEVGTDAGGLVVTRPWPPLGLFLAAAALALLLVEWCLYQRRWTT